MSGINSTPTSNDFAVMNGDLLKAGSSAMLTFSTPTLPPKSERLISPNVTGRPNAFVTSDLYFRTEAVDIDEKRKCNKDYHHCRDNDSSDLQGTFADLHRLAPIFRAFRELRKFYGPSNDLPTRVLFGPQQQKSG